MGAEAFFFRTISRLSTSFWGLKRRVCFEALCLHVVLQLLTTLQFARGVAAAHGEQGQTRVRLNIGKPRKGDRNAQLGDR